MFAEYLLRTWHRVTRVVQSHPGNSVSEGLRYPGFPSKTWCLENVKPVLQSAKQGSRGALNSKTSA